MRRLIDILATGVTGDDGEPLANGTVTFYDAGTTNLRTVYEDFEETGGNEHSNPATLDAAGRLIAYSSYRLKLLIKNSSGATVRTIDDVGTADSDLTIAAASDLAGSGLTAPGDGSLAVNVDGTTLEINSDALRLKDGGVSTDKLADDAVTTDKAGQTLGPLTISNCMVTCSVSSNALTIALKTEAGTDPSATNPVTIAFGDTTLTSGTYTLVKATAATSLVISSGSTLGHTSATEWPIYVYAFNDGGTIRLGASTSCYDERERLSTTAEGGAGAADSVSVIYSPTGFAMTNKRARLIAILRSTQTTAGTWAAVPTHVMHPSQPHPVAIMHRRPAHTTVGIGGVALSASSGNYSTTSGVYADVTNLSVSITTSGRPVFLGLIDDGSGSGSQLEAGKNADVIASGNIKFVRDSTDLTVKVFKVGGASGNLSNGNGALVAHLDFPSAGTYTYKVQAASNNTATLLVTRLKLVAWEI